MRGVWPWGRRRAEEGALPGNICFITDRFCCKEDSKAAWVRGVGRDVGEPQESSEIKNNVKFRKIYSKG